MYPLPCFSPTQGKLALSRRADCPLGRAEVVVEVSVNLLSFTGGEVRIFQLLTAEPILFKE